MTTLGPMPAYVAVYEPPGVAGLGELLSGGKPRPAVLARLTVKDGAVFYRPVLRGNLKDVAELLDTLDHAAGGATRPSPVPIPLDELEPAGPDDRLDLDDLEAGLPAADDPAPCGSAACCQDRPADELLDPDARALAEALDPDARAMPTPELAEHRERA